MSVRALTQIEIEVLQTIGGERPARNWGAAMGQAIETLRSRGLVSARSDVTAAGIAFLATLPVPGTPRRVKR